MIKKVNKKQAGDRSRERIIKTAVKLFARQGFAGTGLRELAVAAGVNLAMVNYFFGTKKELLKIILDRFFSGYLAIASSELLGDAKLQTKVRRFIHRAVNYFATHRDYLIVSITELPHDDPEIIEYKAAWGIQMLEIIDREICRPLCLEKKNNIPPMVLGPMLTSMMASGFLFSSIVEEVQPDGAAVTDINAYVEMIAGVFFRGIGGRSTGSGSEEK